MARPKNETCAVCGRQGPPGRHPAPPLEALPGAVPRTRRRTHSQTFQTTRDAAAWLPPARRHLPGEWIQAPRSPWSVPRLRRAVVGREEGEGPTWPTGPSATTGICSTGSSSALRNRPIHMISRDEVELWYDRPPYARRTGQVPTGCCGRSWPARRRLSRGNPARIRGAGQFSGTPGPPGHPR